MTWFLPLALMLITLTVLWQGGMIRRLINRVEELEIRLGFVPDDPDPVRAARFIDTMRGLKPRN